MFRVSPTAPDEAPVRRVAAFFDLDKTIIAKSSALAFSRPFFDEGLLNRRAVLKSSYAQFLMMLTAADHDQMERMRDHLTQMCEGWNVEQVKSIVREALHDVVNPLVFAEASELIAGHHARGHDVVIVSASGEEMVAPIAEMLGADYAVASKMKVEDGKYAGEVEFYCYGENKVVAMEALAAEHGYDLSQCFAYSDSITDVPMLAAVGHPTAVNPDRGLRKESSERGWPVVSFSNPAPLRDRIPTPSRNSVLATAGLGMITAGVGFATYLALHRKKS
ncbi:HAD family hydrolase [Tsukamurella pseudospumae]|uniref:Inhibition of morphological differentiation protein n=1 Tax=Tsukamurella pseudospumae TaxID=239498 RepID=A0A138AIT2_9ACTN|nr:HAD-IB family hydrolase [Tsukamurella pseudospumae]KXP00031.1 inhibition of morphological differentiation protein [Tsukamurella pseudospumae]KXP10292.1 inhibition of morphological differentiation protein [Tsukamurella pseudospumae]